MHLSTQSHLIRSKGWKKSIAELNQNKILQNVERAGFLAVCRAGIRPFWSNGTIVFGWSRARVGVCVSCLFLIPPVPVYSFPFM